MLFFPLSLFEMGKREKTGKSGENWVNLHKLTSEFNKFKNFGIDLNDAHKITTKTHNINN